jgi:guanylate kinase
LAAGQDLILEIDWQGAAQVRQFYPEAISIFILPPSMHELESRLRGRGQDSDEVIAKRLAAAKDEMSHVGEFDYVTINDKFEVALEDLNAIVRTQRLKREKQLARHATLLKGLI